MIAPTQRTSSTARRILLTILGEFVLPQERPVWNTSLVRATMAGGQTEKAARQVILRAAQSGWLTKSREGKNVCWAPSMKLVELLSEGRQRVYPMERPTVHWDGRWLILQVSLPDAHRKQREPLYRALQWAGFGSPAAGLWVCPYTDRQEEMARAIRKLGLTDIAFGFVGSSIGLGITDQRMVQLSWDLDQITRHYTRLLRNFKQRRNEESILSRYLSLVTEWQMLPFVDPRLPTALLPANWEGQHLAAEFADMLQSWREPARAQWQQIVNATSPRLS